MTSQYVCTPIFLSVGDLINRYIYTNFQRLKLSISAFDSCRWNASFRKRLRKSICLDEPRYDGSHTILSKICVYTYTKPEILWQMYYGRYLAAYIVRQISNSRFITAPHYLRHSSFDELDLDTCLTPEAKNLTDLNYSLQSNVWDGSGPKIEGSGPSFILYL